MKKLLSNYLQIIFGALALFVLFVLPHLASAHEIYVLSQAEITKAVGIPPFNMLDVVKANLMRFTLYGFLGLLSVVFVFFISTIRFFEKGLHPLFEKIRIYGPLIARVTVGLSFLAAAFYQATYGPELPLLATFGMWSELVTAILVIIGVLTTIGLFTRAAAFVALFLYLNAVRLHGVYMLTYINYLGEVIVLLLLGGHEFSIDNWIARSHPKQPKEPNWFTKLGATIAPMSFAILRVCFGTALIYASLYAKVIHNNLALDTVLDYHLDAIFHQEAHFLVLGAAIIEIIIGLFFILGVEIRFTALFLLGFLSASLVFFGETVWPHIILIGIPIAFIFYGYDKYSLEGYFFRKKEYEPIL